MPICQAAVSSPHMGVFALLIMLGLVVLIE